MKSPQRESGDSEFLIALDYLTTHEYRKAYEKFTKLIISRPAHEGVFGNRGICLLFLGRDAEAFDDFQAVIQLNPKDIHGYICAAEALCNLGRHDEAQIYLETSKTKRGNSLDRLYLLAWYAAKNRDYDRAIVYLENFLGSLFKEDRGTSLSREIASDFLSSCQDVVNLGHSTLQEQERILSESYFSFNYAPQENKNLFCDLAHCIKTRAPRCDEAPNYCPYSERDCPGGEIRAKVCRSILLK